MKKAKKLPLSFAQERLWFIDQYSGGQSHFYNMPVALRLTGQLDVSALEQSFNSLLSRHMSLRTVFVEDKGTPKQVIQIEPLFDLTPHMISEDELQRAIESLSREAFDLANGPVFKVKLFELSSQEYILFVNMHHIVSDGVSNEIMVNEFVAAYNAYHEGIEPSLPILKYQYADFAVWQRKLLTEEKLSEQLDYWKEKLDGVEPINLPLDKPRPPQQSYNGDSVSIKLDAELSGQLRQLAQNHSVTMYMLMNAVFSILLSRYSRQDNIVIGGNVANRHYPGTENIIGFFVNTLGIRVNLKKDLSFDEFLNQVKVTCLEAYQFQDIPFDYLLSELDVERDASRHSLFQVRLMMDQFDLGSTSRLQLDGIDIEPIINTNSAHFDITLTVLESEEQIIFNWNYVTDLFEASTIKRMSDHLINICQSVVQNQHQPLSTIDLLSEKEKHQLLVEWNDTAVDYPREKTIHQLFEEQVVKLPHNTAIVYEETSLTYQALNERANQLARLLIKSGVKVEAMVPLCLDRSLEMIIAILAVLKAGGAYVPIDPELPIKRKAHIIKDTRARLVLAHSALEDELPSSLMKVICVDELEVYAQLQSSNLDTKMTSRNLAYVIYTSGSTGVPKGVMVEHRNVVNYFNSIQAYAPMSSLSRIDCSSSLAFDLSVSTSIVPLIAGSSVILCANKIKREPELYMRYLSEQNIDLIKTTPSFISLVGDVDNASIKVGSIKTILLGGEALQTSHVNGWLEKYPNTIIINEYGPTETTVGVAQLTFDSTNVHKSSANVSIGAPCINSKVYLLDHNQRLIPVGVVGELIIGGDQVARGYLNQPKLTGEKFIDNPFATEEDKKLGRNLRLYKTGDLVRWLPDGNLEFIGRIDDQVKIRGFRIELGEIESVLSKHADVSQCVVLAKGEGQDMKLVAYVVSEADKALDQASLRDYLRDQLPDYMIPSFFIPLDSLPLNRNGKIDRKKLPEPDEASLSRDNEFVAPRNEHERILCDIFQSVLKLEQVGIFDNFFHIGGNSISSIQVVSRARSSGLVLQVRDLFSCPTIAELVSAVNFDQELIVSEQGQLEGEVEFLPIQYDMLTAVSNIHHYNQSVLLQFNEKIDPSVMQQALLLLIKQHDALRLRLLKEDDSYTQYYCMDSSASTCDIECIDCLGEDAAHFIKEHCQRMQSSLSLVAGPVMRVGHFTHISDGSERLFIVIHHMMIDGVSWRILFHDLFSFYQILLSGKSVQLGKKTSSYREWSLAVKRFAKKPSMLSREKYWCSVVEKLPEIFDVSRIVSIRKQKSIKFDKSTTEKILKVAKEGVFDDTKQLFVTALVFSLVDVLNQANIPIHFESHGRVDFLPDVDISQTVGWFTSYYPIIFEGIEKFSAIAEASLLKHIQMMMSQFEAVPDEGLSYGALSCDSGTRLHQLVTKSPIYILFNFLGEFDNFQDQSENYFSISSEDSGESSSKLNVVRELLSINGGVVDGALAFNFDFDKGCISEGIINKITERFNDILLYLVSYTQKRHSSSKIYPLRDLKLYQTKAKDLIGKYTPLRAFNNEANQYPLIFIHTAVLDSVVYNEFSNLLDSRISFYCIEPYNFYNYDKFFDIDSLLDYYAHIISNNFKNERLSLGGLSGGAIFSAMILRKLTDKGVVVDNLYLIDQPLESDNSKGMNYDLIGVEEMLPRKILMQDTKLFGISESDLIDYAFHQYYFDRRLYVGGHFSQSSIKTTVFRASQNEGFADSPWDYGWSQLMSDLSVIDIASTHVKMCHGYSGQIIADYISNEILNGNSKRENKIIGIHASGIV